MSPRSRKQTPSPPAVRGPRPPAARRASAAGPLAASSSLLVGAAFLALYLAWAPRVDGPGDSGEFTAVLGTLGLAHPTGYPLYTLVGHAFVVLVHALGAPWAWAANAFSALGAACAVALWHALGVRLLVHERVAPRAAALVALLPAAAFGLNPAWVATATVAEVNSWHVAWVGAACLFAWTVAEALPARRATGLARTIAAWSVLVGLGVAHHATSLFVALPLSIALLVAARPLRAAWIAPAALGLLVPPAAWAYVLFRSMHPAAVQWGSLGPGVAETWRHVTAAGYRHYLGGFAPSPAEAAELRGHVYPWLLAGGGALIAWAIGTRGALRPLALGLAAALVLQVAYTFSYAVEDPVAYFLPALALGAFTLPAALARVAAARRHAPALAAVAALGLVALGAVTARARARDNADLVQLDALLRTMWSAVPLQRGYVLWDSDLSARLVGYQQLEGQKRDLVVVRPRLLMDEGARALFARRHGFDPLQGVAPPDENAADRPSTIRRFAGQIADGINRASRDSVILFQPEQPALRLLPK